jgi:predicted transcriptional regulator
MTLECNLIMSFLIPLREAISDLSDRFETRSLEVKDIRRVINEKRIKLFASVNIRLRNKLVICLLLFLLIATVGAIGYIVGPASGDHVRALIDGWWEIKLEAIEILYWQFLFSLSTMQVSAAFEMLFSTKLFFVIAGCLIIDPENVLNNPSRFRIYTYIKNKPGAYISEIVEKAGLDRGAVKYHLKVLTTQNKIESYKEGGKVRYFECNSIYNEKEIKVISALQNLMNQKIISKIINDKCNTNVVLAREIGVSKATISWYMKNLREIGLIKETKKGRRTIYRINRSYRLLIEKYGQNQKKDTFNF